MKTIDILFDGPPGPEAGRFVEVEDETGNSIGVGEWIARNDGYWALRLPDHRALSAEVSDLEGEIAFLNGAAMAAKSPMLTAGVDPQHSLNCLILAIEESYEKSTPASGSPKQLSRCTKCKKDFDYECLTPSADPECYDAYCAECAPELHDQLEKFLATADSRQKIIDSLPICQHGKKPAIEICEDCSTAVDSEHTESNND